MAKGQKTGGRRAGTPNKTPREDRTLAQKFGPKAIEQIAAMAGLAKDEKGKAEAEATRLGALNAILDRAYGKPSQPIGGDDDMPAIRAALKVAFVGPESR